MLQAFSLVDLPAFRRLLQFQRPSTNERDIPHRTSVANAVHGKAHKVKEILKGLFAVRVYYYYHTSLAYISNRVSLGRYLRLWMAGHP